MWICGQELHAIGNNNSFNNLINYSSFFILKYIKYTIIKPFLINQRSIPYNQY